MLKLYLLKTGPTFGIIRVGTKYWRKMVNFFRIKKKSFDVENPSDTEFEIIMRLCIFSFKGSADQSHFIFEINVGKSRIERP